MHMNELESAQDVSSRCRYSTLQGGGVSTTWTQK